MTLFNVDFDANHYTSKCKNWPIRYDPCFYCSSSSKECCAIDMCYFKWFLYFIILLLFSFFQSHFYCLLLIPCNQTSKICAKFKIIWMYSPLYKLNSSFIKNSLNQIHNVQTIIVNCMRCHMNRIESAHNDLHLHENYIQFRNDYIIYGQKIPILFCI